MDRKKCYEVRHSKNERVGIHTGLFERNGRELVTGNKVRFISSGYEGILLWHREQKCFGIFRGLWYGDQDPYNAGCYGKFIPVPKDQGAKMDLELVEE